MIAIAKPTTRYEPLLLCNEPLLRVINCDFGLASLPVSARPETQVRGLGWSRSRSASRVRQSRGDASEGTTQDSCREARILWSPASAVTVYARRVANKVTPPRASICRLANRPLIGRELSSLQIDQAAPITRLARIPSFSTSSSMRSPGFRYFPPSSRPHPNPTVPEPMKSPG
jgi:hypothetical protein